MRAQAYIIVLQSLVILEHERGLKHRTKALHWAPYSGRTMVKFGCKIRSQMSDFAMQVRFFNQQFPHTK